MSGTDAAATLSLKIDTHGARADLEALKKEYTSLHAAMREGLPKLGGSSGQTSTLASQFKDVQASLSAVSAGVYSVNRALDDIVAAGGKFSNVLVRGAKEAVRQNALLTNSYTGVSAASATAAKSAVDYNALMGSAGKSISSLVKTNALLTDSLTSVSTVASAAGKSVVQYNSLMGTAAPAVAALVKTNALLTDSLTSVSTVASAAGKSVVQYNSLMGTAAPAVAALVKTNALLTDSLTSVSTVASAAGKSVVQYNSLMGTAAPAVAALVKTNALLTDSLTSVSTVASAAGKSVVQYNSLMGTAAPAVAALVKTNALLTDSFRSVSAAASVAGKSVGAYDSLMNIPSVRPVVQTNALLTSSIVSSATASVRGPSATRYDPMMNTLSASLPAAIASVEGSHGSLASATDRSAKAQTHWNKVANEAHAAARGLAGSLGTLWITYGSLVPLLTGAALGSAFVNTAKAGSEFSYQLTFVKALGNESAEAVERLSNAATMLGQNSLQGPVELASGFRILAQAGLSGADSILAMNSVLDLAVVGEMDMAQAGTTLVGVMNAFGLSVTSASHVGDVFAKAAALSQTSVQGMTEAMKTASVVGEQYGATLEDTATAITLLAKVNITGTAAGTSFRNMLKELYAPTAGAAGVIKQLGLETSDAEGKLKSFPDIIYSLRSILEDYNKQSQVNILQKLFGERGAKEAIAMLALTRDEWDKLNGSISNSSGFMRQVASELESTTKGVFSQALNALKTGFVDTFNKTEGPMKDMAIRLKTLFSSPEFNAGLAATVGFMAQLASTALSAASALSILFNAVPNGTGTLALMAASVGAVTLSLSYLTAKVGVVAAGLSSLSAASLIAKTSFSSLSVATLAALSPMAPLYVAVGVLTAAYVLFNSKTPESINSINALNSALDTQITRLQVVNSELTKKIGLEAGSAANDTAAVRKELVTGKAQLAEYDRLLAADLESKRTGKTTVLGDMARNLFTTDEKEREEFAKIREARVRRSELATRLAEAEQKLRIAEGYEDQIRINSAKSQVQELLKQQESESKMATGSKTFVGENSTAAAKEANALFKAQTDEIVKGYKARVDAENTEFNNYKQILDQRVKYGAISQGAENVLLEQAQSKVDARTSSLREAEKQELQTLLASKDATDAEKISMQTRIDEIDAIQKSSEAKRAHILVLNQEKDALKQLSHVRKLENDIAEFAGKEKLSRDKAVSMDTLRKTSNGETIAAVEAYYATLERGQTKLKEYEAAIRDAESMMQSLVVSKTDDIKVTKKQRDELQWSINTQEAVTKAIGDGVVVTRKQYDELQKSINIQEAFSAATRDTADSSLAQSDAMLKASESVEVATESYNKYKAALEEQAQANATLTESLKGPEESLKRMQAALSASFATMDATLNARSFSGFYTTLEGLRAEGNINKEKISQLAEMKAAYEAMGAAGAAAAQQIEAQMIELSAHLDPVADKIRGIFENAFTTFFEDVLNGTKSIKEAFKDLGKSILKEFVSIVAKEASQQLMKVLGGGLKPGESQGLFSFLGNLLVGNGADSVGTDIAATGRSVFDRLKNVGGGGSLGTTLQSIPMIDGGLTPKSMGGTAEVS
jgi:TP901 family phage tail tape measure protein